MTVRCGVVIFAWAWASAGSSAFAASAVVVTQSEWLSGELRFEKNHLLLDERSIDWSDVLFVAANREALGFAAADAVELRNGESWRVRVTGVRGGKCVVKSLLTGERVLDVGLLAAIDFGGDGIGAAARRSRSLSKRGGKSVVGELLWLDGQKVAVGSPLGVLQVPRQTATSYVFTTEPAPEPAADAIELVDGSVFHGTVTLTGGALALRHEALGTLSLPLSSLRSVVRRRSGMIHLAAAPPAIARLHSIFSASFEELRRADLRLDSRSAARLGCASGLKLSPRSELGFPLPSPAADGAVFRCLIAPQPHARGDVIVKLTVDGELVSERRVPSDAEPEPWAVELPTGKNFLIEASFGDRPLFPLGVIFGNPHLRSGAAGGAEGDAE